MTTQHYVDCSNHDWTRGPMDFAAMRSDGIGGGWHKLSDGLNWFIDAYAARFLAGARAAGWPIIGAYHVLWGNRDIRAQADWFLSLLDVKAPWWRDMARADTFVLMSDDEPFGYNVKPTIDQVNGFGDAIRSLAGSNSLGYTPSWAYDADVARMRYPVIGSNYGTNPISPYRPAYPGDASSRWGVHDALLQYGSRLRVGSQPTCDVNAYRGPDLRALISGHPQGADMQWTDPNMPTRLGNPAVYATPDPIIADLAAVLNGHASYYDKAGTVKPPLGAQLDRIEAAAAGALKQVDALTAVVQTLTAGGTSIDTAAVLAAVKDVGDADSAALAAANDHISALTAAFAAAQAEIHQMHTAATAAAQAEVTALSQSE